MSFLKKYEPTNQDGGQIAIMIIRDVIEKQSPQGFIAINQTVAKALHRIAGGGTCEIHLSVTGFENEEKLLYEIPEVCAWANEAVSRQPMLYLLLEERSAGQFAHFCAGPMTRDEAESGVFARRYNQFLDRVSEACAKPEITQWLTAQGFGRDIWDRVVQQWKRRSSS